MSNEWIEPTRTVRPLAGDALLDVLFRNAAAAYQTRSYADAVKYAGQIVALAPTLPNPLYLLGSAQLELGMCEEALRSLAACAALGPRFPTNLNAELRWAQARARIAQAAGRAPRITPLDPTTVRSVSIVICSIDARRYAAVTQAYGTLFAEVPHEIIGIHDARSLCEGYNRGARQATGDILVFSHDDIEILAPDFAARLLAHLARFDVIGIAGTTLLIGPAWVYAGWPHTHGQVGYPGTWHGEINVNAWQMCGPATADAQALDGVLLVSRREVVERIGFDEQTFDGWHLYDVDFTFSAHLAGFRAAVCHDLCVMHHSIGEFGDEWRRHAQRFMEKHGTRLPAGWETLRAPEICLIEVRSPVEWRLLTEALETRPSL